MCIRDSNTSDHFAVSLKVKMPSCSSNPRPKRQYSTKLRWDRADLLQYQHACSDMLAHIQLPVGALLCIYDCCTAHNSDLEHYYNCIVDCLLSASSSCVPQVRVGVEKHWWTSALEELKQESIEHTTIMAS